MSNLLTLDVFIAHKNAVLFVLHTKKHQKHIKTIKNIKTTKRHKDTQAKAQKRK